MAAAAAAAPSELVWIATRAEPLPLMVAAGAPALLAAASAARATAPRSLRRAGRGGPSAVPRAAARAAAGSRRRPRRGPGWGGPRERASSRDRTKATRRRSGAPRRGAAARPSDLRPRAGLRACSHRTATRSSCRGVLRARGRVERGDRDRAGALRRSRLRGGVRLPRLRRWSRGLDPRGSRSALQTAEVRARRPGRGARDRRPRARGCPRAATRRTGPRQAPARGRHPRPVCTRRRARARGPVPGSRSRGRGCSSSRGCERGARSWAHKDGRGLRRCKAAGPGSRRIRSVPISGTHRQTPQLVFVGPTGTR